MGWGGVEGLWLWLCSGRAPAGGTCEAGWPRGSVPADRHIKGPAIDLAVNQHGLDGDRVNCSFSHVACVCVPLVYTMYTHTVRQSMFLGHGELVSML